ncbi:SIR2 family protein [Methanogenium sp. MK-MG]|uniref:SIR2 family protein n=1 Tax=Methanogenium sp. MK-MG TaxID=2599926 RepID=UPI0013ED4D39|nr:SIR2 family protein [Methanogenium sp. MK-MG]KAF1078223.1 hypothetical protein MKMG_00880 [Methanogenium sp. MK-MG]
MYTDNLIPVAHAIHASPKRYALLLGAGISVSAGLPTASDASGNMIREIAAGKDDDWETVIPGGEKTEICLKWFEEEFGEKATFERLMRKLGITKDNRKDGLKKFIYPLDGDGNPISVPPTDAHRCIARLVKSGMISLIITTNFDTLLEDALREEKVRYEVITEESDVKQMSVIPDRCRILKVNGDFERGTLRITPEDLKEYPENIETYLRHIFAEYGLVICGWSGIFDTRLLQILCANDITRYPIFWCLRDKSVVPSVVCKAISPTRIEINDADCFFTTVEVVLERFSRFEPRTTLSAAAAVKKVKDALRDPRPDLSVPDVINSEADRVVHALKEFEYYPPEGDVIAKDHLRSILEDLERITTPLAAMCAALAYYEDGTYSNLISMTIERLFAIEKPVPEGNYIFHGLHDKETYFMQQLAKMCFYPAVLVIYASGIAAVHNQQLSNLSAVLFEPKYRCHTGFKLEKFPYFDDINLWKTILADQSLITDVNLDRFGKRGTPHLYPLTILKEILQPIIPYEIAFYEDFDVFEFFSGLAYIHGGELDLSQCNPKDPPCPLESRAWVKYVGYIGDRQMTLDDYVYRYCEKIEISEIESSTVKRNLHVLIEASGKYCQFFKIKPEIGFGNPSTFGVTAR